MKINKKICVIGLGYVGLPTAVMLAKAIPNVIGYDKDHNLIKEIKKGNSKIKEKDFLKIFNDVTKKKKFVVKNKLEKSDVYIIAVPTPFNFKLKKPDTKFVLSSIDDLCPILERGDMIIIESTCPIGTTDLIKKKISKQAKNIYLDLKEGKHDDIIISYCPERIMPGNIVKELVNNDRVIGSYNYENFKKTREVFELFCKGKISQASSPKIAESIKLCENSFRDINIAFANEISMKFQKDKIDTKEVIKLANYHPRVNILNPSIGVGGHCIPIDPWFLHGLNPIKNSVIYSARNINLNKTKFVIKNIKKNISEYKKKYKKNKKLNVGIFGLTYKEDTNDTRESPSLEIAKELKKNNKFNFVLIDPNLKLIKDIKLKKLIKKLDVIIKLVNHKEFNHLNKINSKKQLFIDAID